MEKHTYMFFKLDIRTEKMNDVNTMYMYSLNFTVFYGIIPSKLLLYVTFWH